ncbi:UNVERIFIED_CONTAM: hypothetical protein Q9R58_14005 [Methylobacteriaceae bacterium AG10]|nr:hypothetical protein [Methylobacteriaceae bacterium AG10]
MRSVRNLFASRWNHRLDAPETRASIRMLVDFFDFDWYAQTYKMKTPKNTTDKINIVRDYITNHANDRNPNSIFDVEWYKWWYRDEVLETIPALHYVYSGWRFNYRPNPIFDPIWYGKTYPDVMRGRIEPLTHYIKHGSREDRKPSPYFDPKYYRESFGHHMMEGQDPLNHYLNEGSKMGCRPNPYFDPDWYRRQYADADKSDWEMLSHYIHYGSIEKRWPTDWFDPDWYAINYSDVKESGLEPFAHYIQIGRLKSRPTAKIVSHAIKSKPPKPFSTISGLENSKAFWDFVQNLLGDPFLITFFAADPITSDERDGYNQRVKFVDNIFNFSSRLYISLSNNPMSETKLEKVSNRVWRLKFSPDSAFCKPLLSFIIKNSKTLYAHSVRSLEHPMLFDCIQEVKSNLILDMHGLVVEELIAMGDYDKFEIAPDTLERTIISHASNIITVSHRMNDWLDRKYCAHEKNYLVLPHTKSKTKFKTSRGLERKAKVIYAGGTHPWQCIDRVVQLSATISQQLAVEICCPQPEAIQRMILDAQPACAENVNVRSLSHAETLDVYQTCDYGIVLREDNIINRVSCPTKLVEYLEFGLVPIMLNSNIGDFKDLGLQYVSLENAMSLNFPNAQQLAAMRAMNRHVIQRLSQEASASADQLTKLVMAVAATA